MTWPANGDFLCLGGRPHARRESDGDPVTDAPSNLAPKDEIGSYNGAFGAVFAIGSMLATLAGSVVLSLVANPFEIWAILVVPPLSVFLLLRHAASRISRLANRA